MPTHLFTYGTLMFQEVWQAIVCPDDVGRDFPSTPARLDGYQIFRVKDALYPGIIKSDPPPSPNPQSEVRNPKSRIPPPSGSRPSTLHSQPSTVPGLLYLDLDSGLLARLDRFEDDFYRRQHIVVACDNGRQLAVEAYIVPDERRDVLTTEPWSGDDFVARGDLDRFLANFAGFQRVESPRPPGEAV